MSSMVDQSRVSTRFLAAVAVTLVAALLGAGSLVLARTQSGAVSPADHWRQAVNDWDAGDYHLAVPHLLALMKSPAAQEYLERVALLTGEYYPSITIANDGRSPKISANGQFVTYETGPTADPMTGIVRTASNAVAAEVPGAGASINAAGSHVVWIRPVKSPEWTAAQKVLAAPGPNSPERTAASQTLAWLTATAGEIVVRDLTSGTERVVPAPGFAKTAPTFASGDGSILFVGSEVGDLARTDIYRVIGTGAPERLTSEPGFKTWLVSDPKGAALVYTNTGAGFRRPAAPTAAAPAGQGGGRGGGGGRAGGPGGGGAPASFSVLNLATKSTRVINGSAPA